MFKNKKIINIVAAALLAVCITGGTVAAYAVNSNDSTVLDATSVKNQSSDVLNETTDKGIDAIGMTLDETKRAAINAMTDDAVVNEDSPMAELKSAAEQNSIDTAGMTAEQIKEALREHKLNSRGSERELFDGSKREEIQHEFGIDTTGMSDEEIIHEVKDRNGIVNEE